MPSRLLIAGEKAPSGDAIMAINRYGELQEFGVTAELHVYAACVHGFDITKRIPDNMNNV